MTDLPSSPSRQATFVLCSKNGGARLRTCLDKIEALTGPPGLQVILVDNGSSDDSFALMNAWASASRFDAKAFQTFVPGNSAGRNVALEQAAGEVIVFIDDDCYAEPTLVQDWLEIFARSDIGYGSGQIKPFNPGNSMLGCNVKQETQLVPAKGFVPRGLVQGSNMAFRRECLKDSGWFDARFGAGTRYAGEEWDVALRASFAGWSGGYFPQPAVSHDHGRTDIDARERLLFYDLGAGAVYMKNLFRKGGWTVAKNGYYEARALGYDPERRRTLLKGCVDFLMARFR
jgi:GT2 family glycosyltransferase